MAAGEARSTRRIDLKFVLSAVLIGAGVFALMFLAWWVRDAFLLVFASVTLATLLRAASDPLCRFRMPRGWALLIVAIVLIAVVAAASMLVGGQLKQQLTTLVDQLQNALQQLEQRLGVRLLDPAPAPDGQAGGGSGAFARIAASLREAFGALLAWGSTVLGALASTVLVIVGGFYIAADPEPYRRGLVQLLPRDQREHAETALDLCGTALRRWLGAQLISMLLVGLMTGLGAWAIGLPAPFGLAILAGLAEFVPIIGPIFGAGPALVLAMALGLEPFLWTAALFLVVQQLESNMITPILQQRIVDVPPALLLFSIVAFGLLFGVLGTVLAGPLTVVTLVLVKALYVRETLGEETTIPGET
jgi:predicted PurR-regulated permease PerM